MDVDRVALTKWFARLIVIYQRDPAGKNLKPSICLLSRANPKGAMLIWCGKLIYEINDDKHFNF